jgi:hypothetical protein
MMKNKETKSFSTKTSELKKQEFEQPKQFSQIIFKYTPIALKDSNSYDKQNPSELLTRDKSNILSSDDKHRNICANLNFDTPNDKVKENLNLFNNLNNLDGKVNFTSQSKSIKNIDQNLQISHKENNPNYKFSSIKKPYSKIKSDLDNNSSVKLNLPITNSFKYFNDSSILSNPFLKNSNASLNNARLISPNWSVSPISYNISSFTQFFQEETVNNQSNDYNTSTRIEFSKNSLTESCLKYESIIECNDENEENLSNIPAGNKKLIESSKKNDEIYKLLMIQKHLKRPQVNEYKSAKKAQDLKWLDEDEAQNNLGKRKIFHSTKKRYDGNLSLKSNDGIKNFKVFRDSEVGLTKEWQSPLILNNNSDDEDIETDKEQIKLAQGHIHKELKQAVKFYKNMFDNN